jgi:hypothetical protein
LLAALKGKMIKEKRKSQRFECLIPSEVLKLGEKKSLIERAIIRNISVEGLKLVVRYVDPVPGSRTKVVLYVPDKKLITPLSGEIVWSNFKENVLDIGIKIKQIDPEEREKILAWLLPKWLESEKIKKHAKQNIIAKFIKKP